MSEEESLFKFTCGRLDIVVEVMNAIVKIMKQKGIKTYIRNAPDGTYEIYHIKDNPNPPSNRL
jgi:hypothetical protein